MVPRSTMEKDLKNQEKALTDDISSLGKKVSFPVLTAEFIEPVTALQVKYLEKQFNDAQSQLRDIVRVSVIPLSNVSALKPPQFNSAPRQ
jgi:prefoldin subunit 1